MIPVNSKSLDKLNRKLKAIFEQYKKSTRKPKEIQDVLFRKGNEMRNYIITEMRNTERAPWSYRKTKDGKRHHPSMPGNFPAVDTGEGIRSVAFDVSRKGFSTRLEIGNNAGAPYLKYLEEGTDRMDVRPWLEPTVKKHEEGILEELERIVPDNVIGFMVEGTK